MGSPGPSFTAEAAEAGGVEASLRTTTRPAKEWQAKVSRPGPGAGGVGQCLRPCLVAGQAAVGAGSGQRVVRSGSTGHPRGAEARTEAPPYSAVTGCASGTFWVRPEAAPSPGGATAAG